MILCEHSYHINIIKRVKIRITLNNYLKIEKKKGSKKLITLIGNHLKRNFIDS